MNMLVLERHEATVLVAHSSALISAGLVSMLERMPGWNVRVWDAAQRPPASARQNSSAQIVIGNSAQVAKALAHQSGVQAGSRAAEPKIVLVTSGDDDLGVDRERLAPSTVAARLPLECPAAEVIDTVRSLSYPTTAHSVPGRAAPGVARGGLAPGALRRVREHIHSQLAEKIDLHALAQIAGLSDCHFARAFKQSIGLPPHRYLMQYRVAAAEELIKETDRALADIALDVGFSDQSHFTRKFADITGETPSAFRRRYR